jgi:hypothetical protein
VADTGATDADLADGTVDSTLPATADASTDADVAGHASDATVTDSGAGDAGVVNEASDDGPTAESCPDGSCVCPADLTLCNNTCANEESDPNNCGGCGRNCPTGGTCQSWTCWCPSGDNECNGACVNEQSDPNNCGACGTTCAGTCTSGQCIVTLAYLQNDPDCIAVDQTSVYWGNYGNGTTNGSVMKVAIAGGGAPTTLSSPAYPVGIAVDGTSVYWTNDNDTNGVGPSSVLKVPLNGVQDGGAPTTLASGFGQPTFSQGGVSQGIAVDGTNVYWPDFVSSGPEVFTVMAVPVNAPVDGGSGTTIASGQWRASALAVDSTSVYWVDEGPATNGTPTGTVMKAPLAGVPDGGAPTTLASGQNVPWVIVVDATSVYWANYFTGTVMQVPLDGSGTPTTLYYGNSPCCLAVDGSSIYWADGTSVMKAPLSGGSVTMLVVAPYPPTAIAVDSTSIYWTDAAGRGLGGHVMKLTPK